MSEKFYSCDCIGAKLYGKPYHATVSEKRMLYKVNTYDDGICMHCDHYAVWYADVSRRQWTEREKNVTCLGSTELVDHRAFLDMDDLLEIGKCMESNDLRKVRTPVREEKWKE